MIHDLQQREQELLIACIREAGGKEICGFLLEKRNVQEFVLVPNHAFGNHSFFISDWDYARVQSYANKNATAIVALVHSHYGNLCLSEGDKPSFRASCLPWIIVSFNIAAGLRWEVFYHSAQ